MVTSVYRTAQARRDAFAVGADAFLLEPIAPEQLVRTIETLLKRKVEPGTALGEAWAVTDALGDILEISAEAAKMLNLSARRTLPRWRSDTFWRTRRAADFVARQEALDMAAAGGKVAVLFVDTFNGTFESENAFAAARLESSTQDALRIA